MYTLSHTHIHIHVRIHLQCDILVSCPIRQTFMRTSIVGVCPFFRVALIITIHLRGKTVFTYVRDDSWGEDVRARAWKPRVPGAWESVW